MGCWIISLFAVRADFDWLVRGGFEAIRVNADACVLRMTTGCDCHPHTRPAKMYLFRLHELKANVIDLRTKISLVMVACSTPAGTICKEQSVGVSFAKLASCTDHGAAGQICR